MRRKEEKKEGREDLFMDHQILKLSMKDTVRNSMIALPIVALFELFMIARWFVNQKDPTSPGALANLGCYCFLLGITLLTLLFIFLVRKNVDTRYQIINFAQSLYAFGIVAWAVAFTYVGSVFFENFDYLVYITIISIVPVFCSIRPRTWMITQVISAVVVLWIASHHAHFSVFEINFSVFTIISVVGGQVLYRVRYSAYQRLIELEQERDRSHRIACYDLLTELPNRRKYVEDLNELRIHKEREDLILAMFDVNGLKRANDNLGHDAGDQLLQGAAKCLSQAFSPLGTVYRVGGDEFTGIFFGSEEELRRAVENLQRITDAWEGTIVKTLSISVGTASVRDHPGRSMDELETIADNAMYEAKQEYYKTHTR